jgi:hypothetical protein
MPVHHPSANGNNLLEVLEKILDKGVVIAGDIKISLADVDLLTIKIRLLVASVDKAKEIGLNWWENDPYYSSRASIQQRENDSLLLERVERLEQLATQKAELNTLSIPENKEPSAIPEQAEDESTL